MIKFNALKNKFPVGAVSNEEKIKIDFFVNEKVEVFQVALILREQNEKLGRKIYLNRMEKFNNYYTYSTTFLESRVGIFYYRFEIETSNGILFCGRDKLQNAKIQDFLPEFQLTIYDKNYTVPEKRRGNITYQIFVDRFNKVGNLPFSKKGVLKEWNEKVTVVDDNKDYKANDFYGGNLKGITEKLDYFSKLGVSNLYLTPIFKSSSNHRYDIGDYMHIDELVGAEVDFKDLIDKAKALNIGIMLDGVFNHTGADSIYFNKFNHYNSVGAYQSKKSKYFDWYTFNNYPNDYNCWWGIMVVPTVTNKSCESYEKFIFDKVIDKWTKFGISGWRFDVVDELPSEFVVKLRNKIKSINPNAVLIGEVWEDATTKYSYGTYRPYLLKNELDGVMNYPLKNAIIDYALGKDINIVKEVILAQINNYPRKSLDICLTMLDSHDTFRILNVLTKVDTSNMTKQDKQNYCFNFRQLETAKKLLKLAVCMQFTIFGSPTIYYGDEVGLMGFDDPLNRAPFPKFEEFDNELLEFYRDIGELHNKYINEFIGSTQIIDFKNLLVYDRISNKNIIRVILNNTNKKENIEVLLNNGEIIFPEISSNDSNIINPYGYLVIKIVKK